MDDELIKTLRATYKQKLPEKINNIQVHWEELLKKWDNDKAKEFYKIFHMITGSSGSYGYPEIGESTRELEVYLKELIHSNQLPSINQIKEIETKLENIKIVINKVLLSNQK